MSAAPALDDAALLADATRVVTGEEHRSEGGAVYAGYVAVLAAGAYGVPATQALLRYVDPVWLSTHLFSLRGLAIGVVAVAGLLLFAYRAGRLRGPVVPDLPFLDYVAISPIDRALVLRRWWRLSAGACVFAGLLAGLVLGAALAITAVTSPAVLLPATLIGALVGLLVAGAWLHGQVRGWATGDRGRRAFLRQRRSLRALHLAALRAQSARTLTIGGAVLAGDLRAARLDVASPTKRGRHLRLHASGPQTTVVARDLLGLRRAPGAVATGTVLVAAAAYLLVHATHPGTPSLISLAGLVLAYLGVGQWAEGLRLHADSCGTPPLFGLPPQSQALAHLVAPGLLYLTVSLVVGTAVVLTGGGLVVGVAWALAMVVLLLAAQLMAAFRGLPPTDLFAMGRGVGLVVLWHSVPLLVPAVVGTAATALLVSGSMAATGLSVLAVGSWAAFAYGQRRVRVLVDAHRD